jgi:hypothetical protein
MRHLIYRIMPRCNMAEKPGGRIPRRAILDPRQVRRVCNAINPTSTNGDGDGDG